jgi:hypothetical protein
MGSSWYELFDTSGMLSSSGIVAGMEVTVLGLEAIVADLDPFLCRSTASQVGSGVKLVVGVEVAISGKICIPCNLGLY